MQSSLRIHFSNRTFHSEKLIQANLIAMHHIYISCCTVFKLCQLTLYPSALLRPVFSGVQELSIYIASDSQGKGNKA